MMSNGGNPWEGVIRPIESRSQLDKNNLPIDQEKSGGQRFNSDMFDGVTRPSPIDLIPSTFDLYREEYLSSPGRGQKFLEGQAKSINKEEYLKGDVQSGFNKFTRGIASRGLSIIPKTLQMLGHNVGAMEYALNYLKDPKTADPNIIWDNVIVNAMNNMDEKLREAMPIYATKKYAEGNILQQMGTANFWADDLFDGIAFAMSAWAGVAGFGAIGKSFGLKDAALRAFQVYGGTIYNTIGESGYEAFEMNKTLRSDMAFDKHQKSFENLTEEQQREIRLKAGDASANTFKANSYVLAVPNFVQSTFFAAPIAKVAKSIRTGVMTGKVASTDINVFTSAMKKAGLGVITEGLWEEGSQAAIQSYEKRRVRDDLPDADFMTYASEWADNFHNTEAQKAMILGAILGGFMGLGAGTREALSERAQIESEEVRRSLLMGLLESADALYIDNVGSIYKKFKKTVTKQDEDGNDIQYEEDTYLNEDGETEIDIEKANKLFYQQLHDKNTWSEFLVAALKNDPVHAEVIKDEALARRFHMYMTKAGYASTEEAIVDLKAKDLIHDNEELGIDKADIDSKLEAIAKIYEQAKDQVSNIKDFTDNEVEAEFKSNVAKALFMEGIKRMSIENAMGMTKTENGREELQKVIDDSNTYTKELLDEKQRVELFKEYKKYYTKPSDIRDQIREEEKKDKPDKDLIEQLEYDLHERTKIDSDPESNSPFSLIHDEKVRLGDFGLRNEYYYNIGKEALSNARIDEMVEGVKNGEVTIDELTNYMLSNKREITDEDRDKIKKLTDHFEDIAELKGKIGKESEDAQNDIKDQMTGDEMLDLQLGTISNTPPVTTVAYQQHQEYINEAKKAREESDNANRAYDKFLVKASEQDISKKIRSPKDEERFFRRKVADLPVKNANDIEKNFNANKDTYDYVGKIQEGINEIQKHRRVYQSKERNKLLTYARFKGYMESLDKAEDKLKKIIIKAAENRANKELENRRAQESKNEVSFAGIGIKVDQQGGIHETIDTPLNDAIVGAVGEVFHSGVMDDASKAKNGQDDAKYYATFATKILEKIKELRKVKDLIDSFESALERNVKKLSSIYSKLNRWTEDPNLVAKVPLDDYIKNPVSNFEALIVELRGSKIGTGTTPIDLYINDKDLLAFKRNIIASDNSGYSAVTNEDLLSFIDYQINIQGIASAIIYLDSGQSIGDQLNAEEEIIKNEQYAPNNQQINTIRESVYWFSTEIGKLTRKFEGWLYSKGLAGTGKTKIVARWVLNSMGYKSNSYLAVSHGEVQLKTLVESIKPENDGILLKDFGNVVIDDDIKLVVLDEVGNLSEEDLLNFTNALIEVNKGRKNQIKVYALGDPSQITRTILRIAPMSTREMYMVHEVSPLTIIHRSNVGSVLELQDTFQNRFDRVTGIVAYADNELGQEAIGTHIATTSKDILDQLEAHKDNKRTKLIVVFNRNDGSEKVKKYIATGADVLSFDKIPGLEFDEVYVDLSEDQFGNRIERFNTAMYTAISRAQQYAIMIDYTGTMTNAVSESVVLDQDKVNDRDNNMMEDYTRRLEFEFNIIGKEKRIERPSTPRHAAPITDNDVDNIVNEDTSDRSGVDEANSEDNANTSNNGKEFKIEVIIDGKAHELEFPEYTNIEYHKKNMFGARVKISGTESNPIYPAVKYLGIWSKNKRAEIHIVAEVLNEDGSKVGGGTWDLIGIVGAEDMVNNPILSGVYNELIEKSSKDNYKYSRLDKGKIEGAPALLEGTMKFSQPLHYVYDKDKVQDSGQGLLTRIIIKFINGFFPGGRTAKTTYEVRIFKNKDEFDGITVESTNLKAGIPYLIIHTRAWKRDGVGAPIRPQYIRLDPRSLQKGDKGIASLQEFLFSVESIEKLNIGKLGEEKFDNLLKRWKRNYILDGDDIVARKKNQWTYKEYEKYKEFLPEIDEKQFKQIEDLIEPVIKLFYGSSWRKVVFTTEEEMRQKKGPNGRFLYKDKKDEKYVFVPRSKRKDSGGNVKRIDLVDKEDLGTFEYEDDLVGGSGQAQMALNLLSRANSHIGDTKFRVRHVHTDRKTKDLIVAHHAKSLLSSDEVFGNYFNYLKSLYKTESPVEFTEKYDNKVDKDNYEAIEEDLIGSGVVTRENLHEGRESQRTEPITSNTLREILAFDEFGRHGQLRLPLDYDDLNKLGGEIDIDADNSALEELLVTNFVDVLPTRIQVEFDKSANAKFKDVVKKTAKTVGKAAKKIKGSVEDEINKLSREADEGDKYSGKALYKTRKTDIGKPVSLDEAKRLVRKLIPSLTEKEFKDVVRFVDQMTLDSIGEEGVYGWFEKGVVYILKNDDGTVNKNIIRHEVFHKIFSQYLTKSDRIKFINSFLKEFPELQGKSMRQIEEEIAIKFQEWRKNNSTIVSNFIKTTFDRILRFFGLLSDNSDSFRMYFRRIDNGYFGSGTYSHTDSVMPMKHIVDTWGGLDNYMRARSEVYSRIVKYLKNGYDGLPVVRKEIRQLVIIDIEKQRNRYREITNRYDIDNLSDKKARDSYSNIEYVLGILNTLTETKTVDGAIRQVNIDSIIRDIYPHMSFKPKDIINPVGVLTDEDIATIVSEEGELHNEGKIAKHTLESSRINQERKTSEAVKDFLSDIEVAGRPMSWREAYIRTLQLLQGLIPSSSNFINIDKRSGDQLSEAYKRTGSNLRTLQVVERLRDLWSTANSGVYKVDDDIVKVSNKGMFVSENVFIYNSDGLGDVNTEVAAELEGFDIVKRNDNQSTKNFINRIGEMMDAIVKVRKIEGVKIERVELGELLKRTIAQNDVAEIANSLISQKELDIRIARRIEFNDNLKTYNISYITGKVIGVGNSVKSQIRNALRERFLRDKGFSNYIIKTYNPIKESVEKSEKTDDIEKAMLFVQKFINSLHMGITVTDIPEEDIGTVQNDIIKFMEERVRKIKNIDAYDKAMDDEGSLITNLANVITYNNDLTRATSIIDSSGKKRYMWSPSNQVQDVFHNITRMIVERSKTLKLPEFLNLPFYKDHNIYIHKEKGKRNALAKIYKFLSHDGIKNITWYGKEFDIPYTEEDKMDWLVRNFSHAFLSSISNSRENNERYVQQFYTPADRSILPIAEVSVMKPGEIKTAIGMTIRQIMSRDVDLEKTLKHYDHTKLIGFTVLRDALGKKRDLRKNPIKEKEVDGLVDKVYTELLQRSVKLTDEIIRRRVVLDRSLPNNHKLNKFIDTETFPNFTLKTFDNDNGGTRTLKKSDGSYEFTRDQLLPLIHAYMNNSYIQSYHLNQIATGDTAQHKSAELLFKRMTTAFAPGIRGLVSDFTIGKKFKMLVMNDPLEQKDSMKDFLKEILEKDDVSDILAMFPPDYKPGDGQGFMLPERAAQLDRAYGSTYDLGSVMKPVHFEVDENGIVRAIKYSSVVLKDGLVAKYPALGNLRSKMRAKGYGEAVFNSAVKAGNPHGSLLTSWNSLISKDDVDIDENSVLELSNDSYRMQFNPVSTERKTALPTQMSYFLNVVEHNRELAKKVYKATAALMRIGLDKFSEQTSSTRGIRYKLMQLFSSPGQERIHDMLADGLSINFPALVDKSVMQLSSGLVSSAVRVEFKGGGLVLQSDLGVTKSNGERLKYKLKDGKLLYVEAVVSRGILPKWHEKLIEDAVRKGEDVPDVFVMNDMFGFRNPSSELHSAVPIKVVDIYDKGGTNLIITPRELVPVMGSDFDVDELWIMSREYDKKFNPIGYVKDKNGQYKLIEDESKIKPEDLEAYHKNVIIESFLEVLSDPRNRERVITPINIMKYHHEIERIERLTRRQLARELDYSDPMDNMTAHQEAFNAKSAISIIASILKVFSYMADAGIDNKAPKLRTIKNVETGEESIKHQIVIDSKPYDTLQTNKELYEDYDGLENSAIDDIKEKILSRLNLTSENLSGYMAMRSIGISLEVANNMMQQPAMRLASNYKKFGVESVNKRIVEQLGKISDDEVSVVTSKLIEEGAKSNMDLVSLLEKDKAKLTYDERKDILSQYVLLQEVFIKANNIGKDLFKLGKILTLIRTMPIEKNELDNIQDTVDDVFGTEFNDDMTPTEESSAELKFSFVINNLLKNNEHIAQSLQNLSFLRNLIERNYYKHSEKLVRFIDTMKSRFSLNVTFDDNAGKNDKLLRDEFIKYFISGYRDFSDMPAWKYKSGEKEGYNTGPRAFTQHFIDKVKKARNLLPDNIFLKSLEDRYDPTTKSLVLRFVGGTSLDTMDIMTFEKAFRELNSIYVEYNKTNGTYDVGIRLEKLGENEFSEFQEDFVTYGILDFGLSFGATNYSVMLPSELYKRVDKDFVSRLGGVLSAGDTRLANLMDHFALQLFTNNANKIWYNSPKGVKREVTGTMKTDKFERNTYHGKDNGIVYDAKYINDKGESFPKIMKTDFMMERNTIYVRVNGSSDPIVYYQKASELPRIPIYSLLQNILNDGYNINENFNPVVRNLAVQNKDLNSIKDRGGKIQPGEIITLTNYHDVTRDERRYVKVDRIVNGVLKVSDISARQIDNIVISEHKNKIENYLISPKSSMKMVDKGKFVSKKGLRLKAKRFVDELNNALYDGMPVVNTEPIGTTNAVSIYVDEDAILMYINKNRVTLGETFPYHEIRSIIDERVDAINERADNNLSMAKNAIRGEYSASSDVMEHLETIYKRTGDKVLKAAIDLIRPAISKFNSKISIAFREIDGKQYGQFDKTTGEIAIDFDKIDYTQGFSKNRYVIDRMIVHEAFHALASSALRLDPAFRIRILEIHNEFRKSLTEEQINNPVIMRAYESTDEFLSYAFSRKEMSDILKNIDGLIQGKSESFFKKIMRSLKEWFMGIIGREKVNSLWNNLDTLMSNYDFDITIIEKDSMNARIEKILGNTDDALSEQQAEKEVGIDIDETFDKILSDSDEIELNKDEEGNELDSYTRWNKLFGRISDPIKGFLRYFVNREITVSEDRGKKSADLYWGSISHDVELLDKDTGRMETYDDHKDRINRWIKESRVRGTILHKMVQISLENVFNSKARTPQYINEVRELAQSVGLDPADYSWVSDNIQDIFKNIGVNSFMQIDESLRDKVSAEVKVVSDLLGIGGTMDLLIKYADGRFGIVDWKTGKRFDNTIYTNLMKFGNQDIDITDNQREHAKLQVMLYAFMLKLNNPKMQFRELTVNWIPSRAMSKRSDINRHVEISSYLGMLEAFFKNKKAVIEAGLPVDIYSKILSESSKIFDVSEYTGNTNTDLIEELTNSKLSPEKLFIRKYTELTMIVGKEDNFKDLKKEDKEIARKLWNQIKQMYADPSMQITKDELTPGRKYEIGKFVEWFGSYSDVPHPEVQILKKFRDRMRNRVEWEAKVKIIKFQHLLEPIVKQYSKGKISVANLGLNDVNYRDLYAFMFKDNVRDGVTIERLVNENDKEYTNLTTAQQKLLDYMNAEIEEWFVGDDAFMNQIATYKLDPDTRQYRAYTHTQHMSYRDSYSKEIWYKGFFPKIMKTSEEVRYDEGGGSNIRGALSKGYIMDVLTKKLTNFIENNYEGWPESQGAIVDLLPIPFLGSRQIDNTRNYSRNMEMAYDQFIKGMLYKKYMDPVYASSKALQYFLEMKKDGKGQPMFENTAGFLEKKIMGDILGRRMRVKYSRLPIRLPGRDEPIEVDKIIEMMMGWVSSTIMWLRPLQGGGNGIHARGLVYREGLKGTIASTFANIDGDAIDFKVSDSAWADKVYFTELVPDAIRGKMQENKMWLLAQHLGYLPDNYDYATNTKFLLSTRNKVISQSTMYMFHSKPEEWNSLTTMAAQLHYLKNPVTGKSLWDSYKVEKDEDGMTVLKWVGGVRGKIKRGIGDNAWYESIEGLLPEEVSKMKKVHERMQGGYRKEEAGNIEIYVMGKAFIQLKKYLPRLIMNTYHSKRYETELGHLKDTGERQDGETIYEWVARLNEGRWRTVINSFINIMSAGQFNRDYAWGSLTTEQKQNVIDAIIVGGMMTIFYGAYLMLFGDEDDDDTLKKWWKMYLVDNLNQQYNPMDLLRTLESSARPVSLARSYKVVNSFVMMMMATGYLAVGKSDKALTEQGSLKGWSEFKRGIPYIASYQDAYNKFMNQKSLDVDFLQSFENKWR